MFTKIWFYSSLPCSHLIGHKLNFCPQVKPVLPVLVVAECSLPVFILTQELLVVFSLSCPADLEKDRVALVGT